MRTEPGALYIHAEHHGKGVADIVICADDDIIVLNGKEYRILPDSMIKSPVESVVVKDDVGKQ